MDNPVLDAIKNRRSVARFESTQLRDEELEAILEAGRWAPSWLNKQPWSFIVIKDQKIKQELSEVVPTTFVQGLKEAPVCIAISVDPEEDPYHYLEGGAVASQNMVLAAQSLGLHSSWIGIFDVKEHKNSAESRVKKILEVPKKHRVISLLPIGHSKYETPKKDRKALRQIVHEDKFGKR
jgi:nitroreductase